MKAPKCVICWVGSFPMRRILYCPTCDKRRRFAILDPGGYYSPTATCCGCGDSWTEGQLRERPFRPGWRAEAKEEARRTWEEAGQFSKLDYDLWINAQINGLEVEEKDE